jgi:DNA primase
MAFPPRFLDEIRARVGLVDTVGRRVKLTRRGREHAGLCPFHNEKTPSFTVNEEKGFYHCFGCGAHGDVIGFVMRTEGVPFPEAVERLAAEAGLEVPVQTPEERVREERRAGLTEILEAAADWYAAELLAPQGRAALDYLYGRGLDDKTIVAFRLGFAPDGGGKIKQAIESRLSGAGLSGGLESATLEEIGLLRTADDDRASYPFFRNRIMFPITDRLGRAIAFGGRAMGDGKTAKYINSPDTPLFHKGRTLYNFAGARQAAYKGELLIVAEGYMDVIALVRAGFRGAVAPLGTALTELQIAELWRLSPEPILCFDGDEAGRRAAGRAAVRTLPLLTPGKSLRFAMLRPGEDPDSLIAKDGKNAIQVVLEQAQPLADVIWDLEVGLKSVGTPEQRADLDRRLDEAVRGIADERVRGYYRNEFRTRLWDTFRATRSGSRQQMRAGIFGGTSGTSGHNRGTTSDVGPRAVPKPDVARRRRQQAVLAALATHPELVSEFADEINALELDGDLDNLRQELQNLCADTADLDADDITRHFKESGQERALVGVLDAQVFLLAPFARAGTPTDKVRVGLRHVFDMQLQVRRKAEVRTLGREMAEKADPADEARVFAFREDVEVSERRVSDIDDYESEEATVNESS